VTCKTKKVIAVSQGTLALRYTDLIVPSIQGLAYRDDILLIVALGKKGATLPSDTVVPPNTRIADWIPFDDLLPHCDAFITNGGYGAFQHGISNGTPLILGGATEDKPEVAMRAEWCGIGINLRSGTPTPAAIAEAVESILESKYKTRAAELQKEMSSWDPIGMIAQSIDELADAKAA
jgi:UDP:flavonoid glycosyltransferase YjiC (YdhE family)